MDRMELYATPVKYNHGKVSARSLNSEECAARAERPKAQLRVKSRRVGALVCVVCEVSYIGNCEPVGTASVQCS